MLKQLQQKVELRKASGLDSWKAVPTPTFQLYLGPCHFTSGFCLKGGEYCNSCFFPKGGGPGYTKTPFKPNPPVKKPGPRSSSKGEDGTASHESKPDAFLSSSFWWSYSHIPGEWFLTWWFLKKSCFGHSWFAYIQISENSSSHVLPEKKPRGTFHSTQ